jgi:hypothetical protein
MCVGGVSLCDDVLFSSDGDHYAVLSNRLVRVFETVPSKVHERHEGVFTELHIITLVSN